MVTIVRSGYMKRYSKSILSGGWQTVWVVLYSDGNLVLYKRQGDMEIKGKANMKEVCKRFAYGQYTDTFPDRPSLPSGTSIGQLFAIPTKNNSQAKVYWLLCSSEGDLNDWMTSICNTLPARPQSSKQHQQPPIQPQTAAPVSYAPPPYQPGPPMPGPPQPQPPSNIGFAGIAGGGYPQAPAPYPTQPVNYPANPYPTQPAPGYQPYPQQAYAPPPPAAYPQQQYQQPYGYAPAPGVYQQPPQGYARPPGQQVVYVQQPHKKSSGLGGLGGSNTTKIAAGLIGGAALGYGASRMMGGGFGGFGFGRHGSWSSLSSFGSCGSFGSFGSFD